MKWTIHGKRGAWQVVSYGFIPVTASDMGQGVAFAYVHTTRHAARQAAQKENQKESVPYSPVRSYLR